MTPNQHGHSQGSDPARADQGWPPPYPQHPSDLPLVRRRRGRRVLMVGVIGVLLAAGITTGIVLASGGSSSSGWPAASSTLGPNAGHESTPDAAPMIAVDVPGWREGEAITEATLAAQQPEEFFWTVYKRQAMVPIQELIQEPWIAPAGKPVATNHGRPLQQTIRTVINYQTKEFAKAETDRDPNGKLYGESICVDGKKYMKTTIALEEGRPYTLSADAQNGARECPLTLDDQAFTRNQNVATWVNDAFMTGGLTSDQADKFIAALRKKKLVSIATVAMVDAAGKKFVAVEGEVNRVVDPDAPHFTTRLGTTLLMTWFGLATGLNQPRHPYPHVVGGLQGLTFTYYLDPATLRPAFSKAQTTPVLDLDGSVSAKNADFNESVTWVQWNYPTKVPTFTLADGEQVLTVAWPQGLPGR